MGYLIGLIGMWVFADSVASLWLYTTKTYRDGRYKQTFWRDHFLRIVRGLLGILLIVIGYGI